MLVLVVAVLMACRCGAGSSIAVFGTGSVGVSSILAAHAVGCANIIAVDASAERCEAVVSPLPLLVAALSAVVLAITDTDAMSDKHLRVYATASMRVAVCEWTCHWSV